MFRTAVILSGQPRFFRKGYEYLSEGFDGLDVDYFFHFWHNEEDVGKSYSVYSKHSPFYSSEIEPETDKKIIELYKPKSFLFEKQKTFVDEVGLANNHGNPPNTTQPPEIFISMLYSRWKAGQVFSNYCKQEKKEYDFLIWTRTDFAPMSKLKDEIINLDYIHTAFEPGEIWNNGGVTTALTASNPSNILHYLNLYNDYRNLYKSGVPFCDHRLSFAQLKELNKPFQHILFGNKWIRKWGLSDS